MNAALTDLDPENCAVIDKDTGTVLGTNLALVLWDLIPEETREEIMASDSAAWDYATEHGTPLHTVDHRETARIRSQADAWEVVANHPALRSAMTSLDDTDTLSLVLAELDRLHALDQNK